MCVNQVAMCHYCLFQRHVHWEYCEGHLSRLIDATQAAKEPLPRPADCPDVS